MKDVCNYEGLYKIDENGNVFSVRNNKFLNTTVFPNGYEYVHLCNGKAKTKLLRVHRLVAEAFILNPYGYTVVDHIDGDNQNNNIENLRWCTQQQNNNFELYKSHQKNNKLKSKTVYQYDSNGLLIAIYPSTKEVERKMNIHSGTVSKWCLGKCEDKNGYKWSYYPL